MSDVLKRIEDGVTNNAFLISDLSDEIVASFMGLSPYPHIFLEEGERNQESLVLTINLEREVGLEEIGEIVIRFHAREIILSHCDITAFKAEVQSEIKDVCGILEELLLSLLPKYQFHYLNG